MTLTFEIREPVWSPCPRCNTETASPPGEVCWDCRMTSQRSREREGRLARAARSVPSGFSWVSFDAPELATRVKRPDLIASARKLVEHSNVVLRGPAGRGKTTVGVAMLRAWVERHDTPAVFLPAHRLSGGAFVLDDDLLSAPLVLIDDLGSERAMSSNLLPDLVYERHARDRGLWVTTWMNVDQIAVRYGDGIARRLFERAAVLDFGGAPNAGS